MKLSPEALSIVLCFFYSAPSKNIFHSTVEAFEISVIILVSTVCKNGKKGQKIELRNFKMQYINIVGVGKRKTEG